VRKDKEDPSDWVTGPVTKTFSFDEVGVYSIFFKIIKADGHYNYATRRVWVREAAPSMFAFFKFYQEDEQLKLVYEGRSFDGSMITNAYYSTPDGDTLPVGRMVLGHVDVIPFESDEPVEITLNIENENGQTDSFTHTVEVQESKKTPYLPVDLLEYAPLETMLLSNFFFDPYGQIEYVAGFNLDFGDGYTREVEGESFKEEHSFAQAGEYEIEVEVLGTEGESYSSTSFVEVEGAKNSFSNILPLVDFRVDGADWAPGVRLYIDESISPISPISSYYWNLGDGQTAYGTEVLHFYDQGAYDVSLTVVTADGSTSSITREVIVLNDAALLYGDIDCWNIAPLQIECSVEGLSRDTNLSEFNIHFGDTPLSEENIIVENISGQLANASFTHTFASEGDYTVTFGVFTHDGEEFLNTFDITTSETFGNLLPHAALDCYPAGNLQADCQATYSNDPDGYIVNYHYDFGDGESADSSNNQIYHTYATVGQYTVTLTVMDNLGAVNSTQSIVNVSELANQFPVAVLNCYQDNSINLICDASLSYDADGEIVSYSFSSSLGETGNSSTFTASVAPSESVTIQLVVEDNNGALSTLTRTFELTYDDSIFPIAKLECESFDNLSISCDASDSTDPSGGNLSYAIYLNNQLLYNEKNFTHIFNEEGSNEVKLIVTNDLGVSVSLIKKVDSVYFKENAIVADLSCKKVGQRTVDCSLNASSGLDFDYEWFKDDLALIGEKRRNIIVEFDNFGIHTVKSTISNGVISKSLFLSIDLFEIAPIANFSYAYKETGALFLDASKSSDGERVVRSYTWSIPELDEEYITNTPYLYLSKGNYYDKEIVLSVIDEIGANDTHQVKIETIGPLYKQDFNIDVVQERGKASKDVNLSVVFPDNEEVNSYEVVWTIDGVEFSGNSLDYRYFSRGEKSVEAKVTQNNRTTILKKEFIIEEINWRQELESSYSAYDTFSLTIANYIPENTPMVRFSDEFIMPMNIVEGTKVFGTIVPEIYDINEGVDATVSIDDETFQFSFSYFAPSFSDNPIVDGSGYFESLISLLHEQSVGTEYENDVIFFDEIESTLNTYKEHLFSSDESEYSFEEKQFFEYLIRNLVNSAVYEINKTTAVNSDYKSFDSILNSIKGTLIAKDITQVIAENSTCKFKLNQYRNKSSTLYAARITLSALAGVVQFIGNSTSPYVKIARMTGAIALASSLGQYVQMAVLMPLVDGLKYCSLLGRIPVNDTSVIDSIDLNMDSFTTIEGDVGLVPGVSYPTSFRYTFGSVNSVGVDQDNELYLTYKKTIESMSFSDVDVISNSLLSLLSALKAKSSLLYGIDFLIDKIVSQQDSLNTIKRMRDNLSLESGNLFEEILVDSNFSLQTNFEEASIFTTNKKQGVISSRNSKGYNYTTKVKDRIQVDLDISSNDHVIIPAMKINSSLMIFNGCDNTPLVRHENGGGFRSMSSDVDKSVYLSESVVCNDSIVWDTGDIDNRINISNSYIMNSDIIGNNVNIRESSIIDSEIGEDTEIDKSLVSESSVINGASIYFASLSLSNIYTEPNMTNNIGARSQVQGPAIESGDNYSLILRDVNIGTIEIEEGEERIASALQLNGEIVGLNMKNSVLSASKILKSRISFLGTENDHLLKSAIGLGDTSLEVLNPTNFKMMKSQIACQGIGLYRSDLCQGETEISGIFNMEDAKVRGFSIVSNNFVARHAYIDNYTGIGFIGSSVNVERSSISGKFTGNGRSESERIYIRSLVGSSFGDLEVDNSSLSFSSIGHGVKIKNSYVYALRVLGGVVIDDSSISDTEKDDKIFMSVVGDIKSSRIDGIPVPNTIANKTDMFCRNESAEDQNGETYYKNKYECSENTFD